MRNKYIVTNFAYGTGPYLRTTELAISVNNFLERRGYERNKIIVPLVYGEKQKKIMEEEFGNLYKKHPNEIILDKILGSHLKSIFYGNESYENYLSRWVLNCEAASRKINSYLSDAYGNKIILELHRSPRVLYNIAPAYFVSFAYISEIYREILKEKESTIKINRDLIKRAIEKIDGIENSFNINFITEPGTFSYLERRQRGKEVLVPPTIFSPFKDRSNIERGIYVTVTGIPGLERLYSEAGKLGFEIYSNDIRAVAHAIKKFPSIITNKNIIFQFARSGWSSAWLSILAGKPMVVPKYDKYDDPEIYFNNICLEKLGLGIVYEGEPLKHIVERLNPIKESIDLYRKNVYDSFRTLDGTSYTAKRIVSDFFK